MADCLNCHKPIPESATTCPRCGADLVKIRAMFSTGDAPGAVPTHTPRSVEKDTTRSFPLVPAVLVLVVVGVVAYLMFFSAKAFPQVALSPAKVNTSGEDPCLETSKCLIVYLAPWCAYCNLTVPIVREIMEHYQNSKEVGVKIIIGNDNKAKLEDMAVKVGANTFVDPDGNFTKAVGTKGVPHWFVVDAAGKQIKELGGFGPMAAILRELDLP